MTQSSRTLGLAIAVGATMTVALAQPHTSDQTACRQSDFVACNRVGLAYEAAGNYRAAVEYFRKTCDGGLPVGCSNLGEFYFDGRGVKTDVQRAFRLFMSACTDKVSSGCPGACIVILHGSTASTTSKFNQDCIQAVQYSCDNGNSWMCPHARRLRASAVVPAIPSFTVPVLPARGVCPDPVAGLVARAYTLSNPFNRPHEFEAFVSTNRSAFQDGGPAVACAATLGAQLVQAGMAAYDPNAYERAMGAGPEHLAPDVARSINSGSLDMFSMGQELSWLAKVFPDVARGSLQSFLSSGTETRVQLRAAMAMIEQMAAISPDFAENLGFARAVAGHYSPLAEEQVLMLARMLPR